MYREDRVREWISALRSGDYAQVRHVLSLGDNDGFCALGVLVDLDPAAEWTDHGAWYRYMGAMHCSGLCSEMQEELGLGYAVYFIPDYQGMMSVAELNDDLKLSFVEIADFLEGILEGTNGYRFAKFREVVDYKWEQQRLAETNW